MLVRQMCPALLTAVAFGAATGAAAVPVTYSTLAGHYSTAAPAGFRAAMKQQYGEVHPNSCAIRLAFALEAVDSTFFANFRSPATFKNKPIRARELADYLAARLPGGMRVPAGVAGQKALEGRRGIVYFANIEPRPGENGVSWHISLWDGGAVVDRGDYFERARSVQFWPLAP